MKQALLITLLFASTLLYSQNLPEESSQMDLIIGEWTAVNKTIKRDGSGEYDVDDQLYLKVFKTLGGHGHQVDWFSTAGEYYGSTLRVYSSQKKVWLSEWFDPQQGIWMDAVEFKLKGGVLALQSEAEDGTGKYEVKREHKFSEDGKTYTYNHYRKYAGMTNWLLIDTFEATRVQ